MLNALQRNRGENVLKLILTLFKPGFFGLRGPGGGGVLICAQTLNSKNIEANDNRLKGR